jgi:acyl carrier protein phosphodiesterase
MNFLAHAYLSGENEKILVGNFIADFVKGRQQMSAFEQGVARGIELHRAIDEFTDTHPVVTESKKRLRPKYRHYAGVIVDVYYDHFLARRWADYHPLPLSVFAAQVYNRVQSHETILPQGVKYMLPYMISGNWLLNYSNIDGIGRALSGMARRTSYVSHMEQAVSDLREHYDLFMEEFRIFFPSLKVHAEKFLEAGDQALA